MWFWHWNQQRLCSPRRIGDEPSLRVRGQTTTCGCADTKNFLQNHLKHIFFKKVFKTESNLKKNRDIAIAHSSDYKPRRVTTSLLYSAVIIHPRRMSDNCSFGDAKQTAVFTFCSKYRTLRRYNVFFFLSPSTGTHFCLTVTGGRSLSFKQSCLCACQPANQTSATDFRPTLVAFSFVIVWERKLVGNDRGMGVVPPFDSEVKSIIQ